MKQYAQQIACSWICLLLTGGLAPVLAESEADTAARQPTWWLQQAAETARRIDQPADRAQQMIQIGRAWAELGDRSKATQTYQLAQNAIIHIADPAQMVPALARLAQAQAAINDRQGYQTTAAEAEKYLPLINTDMALQAETAARIAVAHAMAKDQAGFDRLMQYANQTLQRMDDKRFASQARERVAAAAADAGQFKTAMEQIDRIWTPRPAARATIHLARRMAQAGQIDAAVELIGQMKYTATKIDGLNQLAITLAQLGKAEPAAKLTGQAEQLARSIRDSDSRARALIEVAHAQALVNPSAVNQTLVDARTAAEAAATTDFKAWALPEIAAVQAMANDQNAAKLTLAQAIQAAQAVTDKGAQAWHLARVAEIQSQVDPAGLAKTRQLTTATVAEAPVEFRPAVLSYLAASHALAGDDQAFTQLMTAAETESVNGTDVETQIVNRARFERMACMIEQAQARLANRMAQLGRFEDAAAIAGRISLDLPLRRKTFAEIAVLQSQAGQPHQVARWSKVLASHPTNQVNLYIQVAKSIKK